MSHGCKKGFTLHISKMEQKLLCFCVTHSRLLPMTGTQAEAGFHGRQPDPKAGAGARPHARARRRGDSKSQVTSLSLPRKNPERSNKFRIARGREQRREQDYLFSNNRIIYPG